MDATRVSSRPTVKAAVAQVIKLDDSDDEKDIADALILAQQRGNSVKHLEPPKLEYDSESGDEKDELDDALTNDDDAWDLQSVIEIEGSLEEIGDESLSGGGNSSETPIPNECIAKNRPQMMHAVCKRQLHSDINFVQSVQLNSALRLWKLGRLQRRDC